MVAAYKEFTMQLGYIFWTKAQRFVCWRLIKVILRKRKSVRGTGKNMENDVWILWTWHGAFGNHDLLLVGRMWFGWGRSNWEDWINELETGVWIQETLKDTMKAETALPTWLTSKAIKVHFQWTFWSTSLDSADWPPRSHLMTQVGSPVYSENVRATILAWVPG